MSCQPWSVRLIASRHPGNVTWALIRNIEVSRPVDRAMAKGNNHLDDRETRAAQVMVGVMGSTDWVIDPQDIKGAPPRTHDFNLVGSACVLAVEISTIADTSKVRDMAGWGKIAPDGSLVLTGLSHGWHIAVESDGSTREIRDNLTTWILELERLGIHTVETRSWQNYVFTPPTLRPPEFETVRAMAAAGIQFANVIESLPAGECALAIFWGGPPYNPVDRGFVPTFVSAQLAGLHASDVAKLDAATADRRALFLWLDAESHFDVIRSLDHGAPTGDLKNVGRLDEVWLGRYFIDGSAIAYRWQRDADWTHHEVPAAQLTGTGTPAAK
jgi:hypothetical protein